MSGLLYEHNTTFSNVRLINMCTVIFWLFIGVLELFFFLNTPTFYQQNTLGSYDDICRSACFGVIEEPTLEYNNGGL